MLRPAYLFSTAVLAAVVAVHWQDTTAATDHAPNTAASTQAQVLSVQMPSAPAQTVSGKELRKPAQPQRWVF